MTKSERSKYISAIRNVAKKKYAVAWAAYIDGKGPRPDHKTLGLGYMGAQAVRMEIGEDSLWKNPMKSTVDLIVESYLETAAWASIITDADGTEQPGDELIELGYEWSKDAKKTAKAEVRDFVAYAINKYGKDIFDGLTPKKIGFNFFLTRNGHGAGFWDLGLGEQGDLLTKAAKTFGSSDVYMSDAEELELS